MSIYKHNDMCVLARQQSVSPKKNISIGVCIHKYKSFIFYACTIFQCAHKRCVAAVRHDCKLMVSHTYIPLSVCTQVFYYRRVQVSYYRRVQVCRIHIYLFLCVHKSLIIGEFKSFIIGEFKSLIIGVFKSLIIGVIYIYRRWRN